MEDANREPEPKKLPPGVLRVTLEVGRVIDFTDEPADNLRMHLSQVLSQLVDSSMEMAGQVKSPTIGESPPDEPNGADREVNHHE